MVVKSENNMIKMAKKMFPEKEFWGKLGFIFFDNYNDGIIYDAKLPEGWSLVSSDYPMWSHILDENGFVRGQLFYYESSFFERYAQMNLFTRYQVTSYPTGKDIYPQVIYFGNNEEKLFIAGSIDIDDVSSSEELKQSESDLVDLALNYANKNYPDWQSYDAYWDIKRQSIKRKIK